MSSAGPCPAPQTPSVSASQRQSRFTFRHLAQLAAGATACPLRVIAHVDLDAFYAQCETVRLGLPADQPLAVQQWQALIAVNYAAREFGLSRHIALPEAMKRCPTLVAQHVATWKEGDATWAYHDDAAANMGTHKVSLDHYRAESKKILACITAALPPHQQRVEKAGIDEVFLDLSAQVHGLLLARFPELSQAPYNDPTEPLPLPPTTALDWQADELVDLGDDECEEQDPDWDDMAMLLGAEIVRAVRAAVRTQLKYTCSGGVARNKMLAKLGSGHRKPNQQTVVRTRAVQKFLSRVKLTKIRMLGGKLGAEVVAAFNTESVESMLDVPIAQLQQRLGDETGTWLYNTLRGIDTSEVSSRTQIKSMLSAKSFRPPIATREQGVNWLRIFVADICARLADEGAIEHKRRPKSINLHHRHHGQLKSKQMGIPQGKALNEELLLGLATTLFTQILAEGNVWPCAHLSLSIGGFDDGVAGNMGIGAFLVKGAEAEAMKRSSPQPPRPPEKRRRQEPPGISRFFTKPDIHPDTTAAGELGTEDASDEEGDGATGPSPDDELRDALRHDQWPMDTPSVQDAGGRHRCGRCGEKVESGQDLQSHLDWHFAHDLQQEEDASAAGSSARRETAAMTSGRPGKRSATGGKPGPSTKVEKGQKRLHFGR